MAKGTRGRRGVASRQCRYTPYPLPSNQKKTAGMHQKNFAKTFKKDWEDATCSVCMECPHNAVLLLCSSHEKGCRPYMCGTSFRYSNCLDQYKKAYTKVAPQSRMLHDSLNGQTTSLFSHSVTNSETTELACPLCRGQVKGWTVVEPAREHLNSKKRNCTQDNCLFNGTFKELRKHVRATHPSAKPREVDPTLEQKWRSLEREREREDVISTIRSSMPGAVVFGDYVLEGNHYDNEGFDSDTTTDWNGAIESGTDGNLMSLFLFLQAFGSAGNTVTTRNRGAMGLSRTFDYSDQDNDNDNGHESNHNSMSLASRLRRQGRVVLGRSGRRRRNREAGT